MVLGNYRPIALGAKTLPRLYHNLKPSSWLDLVLFGLVHVKSKPNDSEPGGFSMVKDEPAPAPDCGL